MQYLLYLQQICKVMPSLDVVVIAQ